MEEENFVLQNSFNYNNNNFFTDNLLPLPSSDFPSIHYNQLVLNSPPPQLIDDSSQQQQQQLFHFLPDSSHTHSSPCPKRPRFGPLLESVSPSVIVSQQQQRESARQRRQSIGDKVRCLQKLLPCERKMDTATSLEEAYKYVKFLQAQIKALVAMPVESSFVVQSDLDRCRFGGGLKMGMLDRQQALQVLVNSPVAQTTLYSKGLCVFSLEQLILMNKLAHAKLFLQQHYFS